MVEGDTFEVTGRQQRRRLRVGGELGKRPLFVGAARVEQEAALSVGHADERGLEHLLEFGTRRDEWLQLLGRAVDHQVMVIDDVASAEAVAVLGSGGFTDGGEGVFFALHAPAYNSSKAAPTSLICSMR